jgi:hypothetical protein
MMHHVPQPGLTVPAVAGPVERGVRHQFDVELPLPELTLFSAGFRIADMIWSIALCGNCEGTFESLTSTFSMLNMSFSFSPSKSRSLIESIWD